MDDILNTKYIKSKRVIELLSKNNEVEQFELYSKHSLFPLFIKKREDKYSQRLYIQHIKNSIHMSSEMLNLIVKLQDIGITPIPFKGPALSYLIYGNTTERQYSDLDIYIPKNQKYEILNLLKNIGYTESSRITHNIQSFWFKYNKDITMRNIYNGISVDLHWNLFDSDFPIKIDKETIYTNLIMIKISNRNIYTFNTELYLLYLSIHGAKHFWSRIGWIRDIDRLISIKNCDIEKTLSLTNDIAAKEMILLSLLLSKEVFNTKISDNYFKSVDMRKLKNFKEFIYKNWTFEHNQIEKTYAMLSFLPTLSKKILYIKNIIFKPTSHEFNIISLPSSLFFLYYIIRVIRLIVKYIYHSLFNK